MEREIEILAPAGSYESLVAGVNAGALAVYIGGSKFGARASAKSTTQEKEDLIRGIEYAHRFGVKVYLTVNTLLKDEEIDELYEYILPYYLNGIDALIVQDLGVLNYLHERFPNVDKHISTQLNTTLHYQIKELKKYGVTRIVTARELSLVEIKEIYDKTKIEIESFVHGALCYAYSGQCLMSSLIGGRSGNRGKCAQTCRLEYNLFDENNKKLNKEGETYLLSCKDLSTLDILPDLIEAGVYSFKIEGRMKSASYTAGVVSIFKKYLDLYKEKGKEAYSVDKKDKRLLLDLFDRGGHSIGFYKEQNSKEVIALRGKPQNRIINEEFNTYLENEYVNRVKKLKLDISLSIRENKEILVKASLKEKNIFIEFKYQKIEKAKTKGASICDIKKQILKMGNTFYEVENLDIHLEENLFVPVKTLNEIRRLIIKEIDYKVLSAYYRDIPVVKVESKKEKIRSKAENIFNISIEEREQLEAVLDFLDANIEKIKEKDFNIEISYPLDVFKKEEFVEINKKIKQRGCRVNLYLPHIFRKRARDYIDKLINEIELAKYDAIIVRNLEEYFYIKEIVKDINIISDYTLYDMNKESAKFYEKLDIKRRTLPVELNLKELRKLDLDKRELIIYGHLSMMVSASCLRKNTIGCDKVESVLRLKDRMNKEFYVKNHCIFCYNTILNYLPLSSLSISREIKSLNISSYRLMFTIEKYKDVKEILDKNIRCYIFDEDIKIFNNESTKGHFKRGIS